MYNLINRFIFNVRMRTKVNPFSLLHLTIMILIAFVVVLVVSIHETSGFLLQNGTQSMAGASQVGGSSDMTTQYLLGLLVDEKNSRHQLENLVNMMGDKLTALEKTVTQLNGRIVHLEQYNAEVTRKLEKERNNREYLENQYSKLELMLNNLTSLAVTEQKFNITTLIWIPLEQKLNNISAMNGDIEMKLNNITAVNGLFEQRLNNVTAVNGLLEKRLNNVTLLNSRVVKLEQSAFDLSRELNISQTNTSWLMAAYSKLERRVNNIYTALNDTGPMHTVGFTAYNAHVATNGGHNSLGFSRSSYNSDDSFNVSTGTFTCKIPGVYVFTTTVVRKDGNSGELVVFITVNNTDTIRVFANGYGDSQSYPSASGTLVVKLGKNDQVFLSVQSVEDRLYGSDTNFSGFLLTADR